jgi:hypothetical protein
MFAIAIALGAALSGLMVGSETIIAQMSCLGDQTVVALTSTQHVVVQDGSAWRSLSVDGDRLWASPDGRVFVIGTGPFVQEVTPGRKAPTRWSLPAAVGLPRLTFVQGVVAVTDQKMFRLDQGGKVTEIGTAPIPPDQIARTPLVISAPGRLVACYETSFREGDAAQGACLAPPPRAYEYLVDFGGLPALGQRRNAAPFLCGGAIVSVHSGLTQARDLVTGKRVGGISGEAVVGSGCLAGSRAVLVGKNDVRIALLPSLRSSWHKAVRGPIGAAAICGSRLAFVRSGESALSFLDLPLASQQAP